MNPLFPCKIFIVLFVSLIFATSASAVGKGFYPDGTVKWEYLFQDGKVEEAKWYNEQGQLVTREIYKGDETASTEGYRPDGTLAWQVKNLDGERKGVTRFDKTGNKAASYETVNDQPDGEYTTYYKSGRIRQIVTYKSGTLEGPATTFFESGQKEHEFSYVNGQVDGIYRTYSEEGNLLTEYSFREGQLE